jgi:hypothetical protein
LQCISASKQEFSSLNARWLYSAHKLYFFFVSPRRFSRSFLDFPFAAAGVPWASKGKQGMFETSSKAAFFEVRFFCCPVLTDAECRVMGFTGVASGGAIFSCLGLRVQENTIVLNGYVVSLRGGDCRLYVGYGET